MADKTDIAKMILLFQTTFPNYRIEPQTPEVLLRFLGDIPFNDLEIAAEALLSEPGRQFAPSVGEIRGKIAELSARAAGVPSAWEAWDELQRAPHDGWIVTSYVAEWDHPELNRIERVPYVWSHPLVEKVARLLGWPLSFPGDNVSVSLAQWRQAYESTVATELKHAAEVPAVTAYVEARRQEAPRLDAGERKETIKQWKQLTEKLGVKKQ